MKKFISEFKEFALKGNMLDLAIGLMIGTAFNGVVKSIVDDILMPIIGIIIGGHDFSKLEVVVGTATIKYGMFIQNAVNFLIIALCLFTIVKVINKLKRTKEEEIVEEVVEEIKKSDEALLLEEIKNTLVEIKNKQ